MEQNEIQAVSEQLSSIRRKLECNICHELMTEPWSLRCGHSYCKLCLEQHFLLEKCCPECPLYACTRRSSNKSFELEKLIVAFKKMENAFQLDSQVANSNELIQRSPEVDEEFKKRVEGCSSTYHTQDNSSDLTNQNENLHEKDSHEKLEHGNKQDNIIKKNRNFRCSVIAELEEEEEEEDEEEEKKEEEGAEEEEEEEEAKEEAEEEEDSEEETKEEEVDIAEKLKKNVRVTNNSKPNDQDKSYELLSIGGLNIFKEDYEKEEFRDIRHFRKNIPFIKLGKLCKYRTTNLSESKPAMIDISNQQTKIKSPPAVPGCSGIKKRYFPSFGSQETRKSEFTTEIFENERMRDSENNTENSESLFIEKLFIIDNESQEEMKSHDSGEEEFFPEGERFRIENGNLEDILNQSEITLPDTSGSTQLFQQEQDVNQSINSSVDNSVEIIYSSLDVENDQQ